MPDDDDLPTTTLLREARRAYGHAIRHAMADEGLGDLPAHSAFVLGGLNFGAPIEWLLRQRRRELERSGTIDALVGAGCLEWRDGELAITERGREVSRACAEARERLDDHVAATIGTEGLATMRRGLLALIDWNEDHENEHEEG
jgi:hypothetical protein